MFNALGNSLAGRNAPQDYLLSRYGGAAAAYSLQRLTTSVDSVVRARESVGDTEADFTSQEVSGGALREFALQNDADLIAFADGGGTNDRMYFDGSNDRVDTGYKADDTTDFFVEAKFFMTALVANQTILADAGTERLVQVFLNASNQIQANVLTSAGLQGVATGSTTLVAGQIYTVKLEHDVSESRLTVYIDGVSDGTGTYTGTFTPANYNAISVGGFPSGILDFNGSIYDVNLNDESTYNGYGVDASDWEDQTGSNDGSIQGSPALFSGQGFDAFVTNLYDQSGSLGQPLSRFAQHAGASDYRMEFDGVDDYVQVDGMGTGNDYFGACTIQATIVLDNSSDNQVFWSLGSTAYRIQIFSGNWYLNGVSVAAVENVGVPQVVAVTYSASGQATELTVDGVSKWTGTVAAGTNGQTWFRVGYGTSLHPKGLIYDVSVSGSAVKNFTLNGYGITDSDWEDQVGSNDGTVNGSPAIYQGRNALQATSASQPQIVADGVVVTDNGKPAIDLDGTNDSLSIGDLSSLGSTAGYLAAVLKAGRTDNQQGLWYLGTDAAASDHYPYGDGNIYDGTISSARKSTGSPVSSITDQSLYSVVSTSSEWTSRIDGAQQYTTATNTPDFSAAAELGKGSTGLFFQGAMQEVVIYGSDQSSNRAAIEVNIAARYGISI
jgi:hypothetical protein